MQRMQKKVSDLFKFSATKNFYRGDRLLFQKSRRYWIRFFHKKLSINFLDSENFLFWKAYQNIVLPSLNFPSLSLSLSGSILSLIYELCRFKTLYVERWKGWNSNKFSFHFIFECIMGRIFFWVYMEILQTDLCISSRHKLIHNR